MTVFRQLDRQGRMIVYYGIGYVSSVMFTTPLLFASYSESIRTDYPCSTGLKSFASSLGLSIIWPIILPQAIASVGDRYVANKRERKD